MAPETRHRPQPNRKTAHPSCWSALLIGLVSVAILSGCRDEGTFDWDSEVDAWPSGLVSPVPDATFSMAADHLPGAPRDYRDGTSQGFAFYDGMSGRPLAPDEAIVAIAAGQIIRIDHDVEDEEAEALQFWTTLSAEDGFIGEYALDRLRGRQIWIRHAEGHVSRYARLSTVHPELRLGDDVEQGQVIGLMGNSGAPPTEDQPEPAPHLHFELWSADGNSYLGEGLSPLDSHRAITALFSEEDLPRYARRIVKQVNAGNAPPESYPPETLPDFEFSADPPVSVAPGVAFGIPITWLGDDFQASDFFATLDDFPLATLDVGSNTGLAWMLGSAPLDTAIGELGLVVNAIDPIGRTLTGTGTIQIQAPRDMPQAREVSQAYFEQFSDQNRQAEGNALGPALLRSLQMSRPLWQQPFQPPLEGEVVGPFGQKFYFGILRPAHPRPGVEIRPDQAGTDVLAVNDGIVAMTLELPIRGKTVALIHGSGVVSVYGGLGTIRVGEGDSVVRSQQLGSMPPGDETASLRWEMHVAGTATNPLPWIDKLIPGQ